MAKPTYINPDSIRTVNPSSWPQVPFDASPPTPEQSAIAYGTLMEEAQRVRMRDGVELVYDTYRPYAPGEQFPALISWSPYTRQLQQTVAGLGQNEAGLTEFWVPRGYAQVIVDIRGSNDSQGSWDHWGPEEQADLKETIEHIAGQPWCNGNVGMVGCSYFGMSQLLGAEGKAEPLKAIFPYDAATDLYRDAYFHGGIMTSFAGFWFNALTPLNLWTGRLEDPSGFPKHFGAVLGGEHDLDGPYYHERSSWPTLDQVETPSYFGCDWRFYYMHLRGAFSGWEGIPASTPKKMLIGPRPEPRRPFGQYHVEALRWYDHYLKGLDSGVWEGAPINLYVQGEDRWRGEQEWPLARTEWTELSLGTDGSLSANVGAEGERTYTVDPMSVEARHGEPTLVWRSAPYSEPTEITGPMALTLVATSDAVDTDWFVVLNDEAPDGSVRELTRGWLRASHRATDPGRSKPYQPWRPHTSTEPVTPGEATEYVIEIIPTCNVFQPGHRLQLQVASVDDWIGNFFAYHRALPTKATNTIHTGRGGSRLLTPFIFR